MNKETLLEHLTYDKEAGKFTWVKPTTNSIKVGDIAGTYHRDGYIKICIHGKIYAAHRLVWFMENGSFPDGDIDHINCKKDDNRISNLRVVSKSENQMNQGVTVRNKSGVKGVHWDEVSKKWVASLRVNGKKVIVGMFDDIAIAASEIMKSREHYHGEFSNHG